MRFLKSAEGINLLLAIKAMIGLAVKLKIVHILNDLHDISNQWPVHPILKGAFLGL